MRLGVIVPAGQGGQATGSWSSAAVTSVSFVTEEGACDFSEVDVVVATIAMLPNDLVAQSLVAFANDGGAVLGLGLGFGALCDLELLPGRLQPVRSAGAPTGYFRTEGHLTPFTAAIPAGRVHSLRLDVGYVFVHESPVDFQGGGQVVFRFCDAWAGVSSKDNVFGSAAGIAGLSNSIGNVVGVAVDMNFNSLIAPGGLVDQLLRSASLWIAR